VIGDGGPQTGRDVSRYIGVELREVVDPASSTVRVRGHAQGASYLRGPHGGLRAGALLTLLDNVGGLCGGLAALPDGWVVSTNLSARTIETAQTGPLRIEACVLRQGRTSVLTEVEIRDEGEHDRLVMNGVLTSAILVPKDGPPAWKRPLVIEATAPPSEPAPTIPEWLGTYSVDAHTLEMPLADSLRNPWGILHGGALASLIDLAAAHVTGGVTTDVVLHFLAPNRQGPVRAEARPIGTRADGTVSRVEVRDEGAGRVTALAVVTSRAL
jgi:uncharacterized protein (TIGR00369 family)